MVKYPPVASKPPQAKPRPGAFWFDSATIAAAGLGLVASALWVPRSEWSALDLLFWCLLSAALQGSSVKTPWGFTMGHGFVGGLTTILVFRDPLPVMIVLIAAGIGEAVTTRTRRRLASRLTLFNLSLLALAGAAGVFGLQAWPSAEAPLELRGFLSALPVVAFVGVVAWFVNVSLLAAHLYAGYGDRPIRTIGKIAVYSLPSLLIAAPVALLGAYLYVNPVIGGWGVLALMVPVFLTRALWIHYAENENAHADTLVSLVTTLEQRDPYTYGHSQRVTEIALAIARELGLPPAQLRHLRRAGMLHDIGKVAVPDKILLKPGPLTSGELAEVRRHVDLGVKMLGQGRLFQAVRPIVAGHHERWDGQGYPQGLQGRAIPFLARVLAAADTYEAMTSDRAYRSAKTPQAVAQAMREMARSQLDSEIVEAFLRLWAQHPPWREKRPPEREPTVEEAVAALLD